MDKWEAGGRMASRSGHITVQLIAELDEGHFASYCPDLDVASEGDTLQEAFANLQEAIVLHLNALSEHREVWKELRQRGVVLRQTVAQEIKRETALRPGTYVTSFSTSVAQYTSA